MSPRRGEAARGLQPLCTEEGRAGPLVAVWKQEFRVKRFAASGGFATKSRITSQERRRIHAPSGGDPAFLCSGNTPSCLPLSPLPDRQKSDLTVPFFLLFVHCQLAPESISRRQSCVKTGLAHGPVQGWPLAPSAVGGGEVHCQPPAPRAHRSGQSLEETRRGVGHRRARARAPACRTRVEMEDLATQLVGVVFLGCLLRSGHGVTLLCIWGRKVTDKQTNKEENTAEL